MKSRYFDPPRPRLFGHRGSAGHHPENTLPSFQAAVDAGLTYLELDVWGTKDGHIVVHHDETAWRTCGVPRRIPEMTLAQIKALDAGWGFSPDGGRTHPFRGRGVAIPTLEELFQAFPEVFFNIEIKQQAPPVEDLAMAVIRREGKEDAVLLAAEKDAVMARLRPACGEIPTSLSYRELAAFFAWVEKGCRGEYRAPGAALQIPRTYGGRTLVTPEAVQAAHAAGMEMHVWTVNDPEEMKSLLEMGVDGIMTDFPQLLAEVACSPKRGSDRGKRDG